MAAAQGAGSGTINSVAVDDVIAVGLRARPFYPNARRLWRVFCTSSPKTILEQELASIRTKNSWNDYTFSIKSLPDIERWSGEATLFGVDLFVVQIVIFRTRALPYDRTSTARSLSDLDPGEDFSDLDVDEKLALNELGDTIRREAHIPPTKAGLYRGMLHYTASIIPHALQRTFAIIRVPR
jgi:hypothetical protein